MSFKFAGVTFFVAVQILLKEILGVGDFGVIVNRVKYQMFDIEITHQNNKDLTKCGCQAEFVSICMPKVALLYYIICNYLWLYYGKLLIQFI